MTADTLNILKFSDIFIPENFKIFNVSTSISSFSYVTLKLNIVNSIYEMTQRKNTKTMNNEFKGNI